MLRSIVVLAAAWALAGCSGPSISPIYSADESELIKDEAVVGRWTDEDGKTTLDVTGRPGQRSYQVRIAWAGGDKSPVTLEARLVILGDRKWVDLYPSEDDRQAVAERYGLTFIPAHVAARYEVSGDRLSIIQIDNGWLSRRTRESGVSSATLWDDLVVFTGSTAQTRQFLAGFAGNDEAFVDPVTLTRVASEQPAD